MRAILLSTQPQWCELMANGKKTIEVRKTAPKLKTPFKCYIYCTQGKGTLNDTIMSFDRCRVLNGKVIGEFICDRLYDILPHDDGFDINQYECGWKHGEDDSCLMFDEFRSYLGVNNGYGWHISQLKIYDTPKGLREFLRICNGDCVNTKKKVKCPKIIEIATKGVFRCDNLLPVIRPPQSWCYVQELTE